MTLILIDSTVKGEETVSMILILILFSCMGKIS